MGPAQLPGDAVHPLAAAGHDCPDEQRPPLRGRPSFFGPTAAKGSTQRATLTITVNASGNITNVTASGPDEAVNEAAKQAVLNTGSLPIDADDPKYPTITLQFKGSN